MSAPQVQIAAKVEPRTAAAEGSTIVGTWTALAAITLVTLAFLLYWPTTASLMVRWEDTVHRTYTHGYLVFLLTLWLIWRERADLCEPQLSFAGLVGVLCTSLVWLVAWRAGLQIVHQALLPLLAASAVLTCCGWKATRRIAVPLGFLYLAVPVWDALNSPLQWISVFAVRALLRLAGIPAFFADNTFQLPLGAFAIADGCSGLHFFVVAVSVAVLYGAINRDTFATRAKLVLLAAILAMATNWLRIFIIVVAGHLSDMQHYLVTGEHYSFGWFVFAGTMLLYFVVVRRWPLQPARPAAPSGSAAKAPHAGVAVAVAAMLPAVAFVLLDKNVAEPSAGMLPVSVAEWESIEAAPAHWSPRMKGADAEERMNYRMAEHVVEGYAATYLHQRQGKEAVGYGNSVLGDELTGLGAFRVGPDGWIEQRARDSRGEEWLVRHAYLMDDTWYARPLSLQLAYGVRSLSSNPLTTVIAVRASCGGDCETAHQVLDRFTSEAWQ